MQVITVSAEDSVGERVSPHQNVNPQCNSVSWSGAVLVQNVKGTRKKDREDKDSLCAPPVPLMDTPVSIQPDTGYLKQATVFNSARHGVFETSHRFQFSQTRGIWNKPPFSIQPDTGCSKQATISNSARHGVFGTKPPFQIQPDTGCSKQATIFNSARHGVFETSHHFQFSQTRGV